MKIHEQFMQRCLELAVKGLGQVAPNPMVGCVIVHEGKIIGEGYHQKYGEAHAEVNAIAAVKNKEWLKSSTLYVSLEPCAHFGKTPPCADLIVQHHIPRVVIGCLDPHPSVKGKGIEKLIRAGIDVRTGVLEAQCREVNKRFLTFFEKGRPYIILKWAQSADGFTDRNRVFGDGQLPLRITGDRAKKLTHQWRSEEQAILVGTRTALLDNPQLTAREVLGRNPLRLVIDKTDQLPASHYLLDDSTPTVIYTFHPKTNGSRTVYAELQKEDDRNILEQILKDLVQRRVHSVLVEGGTQLLNNFLAANLWDEARIFTSSEKIGSGVKAPVFKAVAAVSSDLGADQLDIYFNTSDKKL